MTKRRLSIRLTPEADRLLLSAVRTGSATKSGVVDAAIKELLGEKSEERELAKLSARLNKLTRAMERLADDATAQTESLALFILYYLCITPPLPDASRGAAEALGRKRFDHFVTQVAERLLGRERYADALLAKIDLERADRNGAGTAAGRDAARGEARESAA